MIKRSAYLPVYLAAVYLRGMKPSKTDEPFDRGSMREGNAENRKETPTARSSSALSFRVGSRVERELDGLWFPASIVALDDDDGTFELEYDEDHNRETDIALEELR